MEYIWMPGWCLDGALCVLVTIGVWIVVAVALAVGAMLGIRAVLWVGNRLFGRLSTSASGTVDDTKKHPTKTIMDGVSGPFKLSMLGFSMTAKGPVGKIVFIALLSCIPATATGLVVPSIWPPGVDSAIQAGVPLVVDGVLPGAGGNSSIPCGVGEPACAGMSTDSDAEG